MNGRSDIQGLPRSNEKTPIVKWRMDVGQMIEDEEMLICEPVLRYMMRTAPAHELEQDLEKAASRLSRFGVFTLQQIDDLAVVYTPFEHFTQMFYFASGMMNAFKMYLGLPLPNPNEVDEETLMDSERLYGQDEYRRMIEESRVDCQTIYGGKADLPEHMNDAVDGYLCAILRLATEQEIYQFVFGVECGIRLCKRFDEGFQEDIEYLQALYRRLDPPDDQYRNR